MTIKKASAMLAASSVLALSLSGLAYADDASISNTGPNSTNTVTIDNNQDYTVNNDQDVSVTNTNNQTATSGSADVSNNTTGGNATTGDATNNNSTSTTVSFSGMPANGVGGGQTGGSTTTGGGGGAGGQGGGSLPAAGASSSSKGGVGGGSLPQAGPNDSVDVSALRDKVLGVNAPTPEVVKKTNNLSTSLLIAAALLSLMGAVGSAVYASKKEKGIA